MEINKLLNLLEAKPLLKDYSLALNINTAFAADLLSDVLALTEDENAMLITGTANMQVIRVAEILDIACIIFVRGKLPDNNTLKKAMDLGIPLISTNKTMFETCGILYSNGIKHCKYKHSKE